MGSINTLLMICTAMIAYLYRVPITRIFTSSPRVGDEPLDTACLDVLPYISLRLRTQSYGRPGVTAPKWQIVRWLWMFTEAIEMAVSRREIIVA